MIVLEGAVREMKSVLFFTLICLLGIVLWLEAKKYFKIEGFQDKTPAGASPSINVPKVKPDPSRLYPGSPDPYTPPSTTLLAPPPGQTASVNSYVYEDPAMKSAKLQRLRNVSATLNGFLANESDGLSQLGDPSVTLPLGTARADAQRLKDELDVLIRNPGLKSSLTEKDLDQIEANLGYLQRKWRMSANLLSEVEGFQSGSATLDSIFGGTFSGSSDPFFASIMASGSASGTSTNLDEIPYKTEEASDTMNESSSGSMAAPSGSMAASSSQATSSGREPISLNDLNELQTKIAAEITRLRASGSQDPTTLQRIAILEKTQKDMNLIQKQIAEGTLKDTDIPLTKDDIAMFLPALSNPNSYIPDLIRSTGAPSGLNNLFPYYKQGDVAGADMAKDMFTSLYKDVIDNTSLDVGINVRYIGKGERKIAEDLTKAYAIANLPSNANVRMYGPGDEVPANTNSYGGMFTSAIKALGKKLGGVGTDEAVSSATNTGEEMPKVPGAPSHLNWKDRATEICSQIEKREMNPQDFGCLKTYDGLSENFSYRGYAKMVCARIATHYDPSIPTLVGCPPPTWPGWKA